MQYRRLGRSELSVSTVGLGTWQLAGFWDKHFTQGDVDRILRRAQELGVNFLDTAECYGAGHSAERFIGNAIAGARDKWIVATKFGHNPENDLDDENFGAAQVLLQLESSLRALRTDVIDVYQMHSGRTQLFENDELWTMLDKQVQAGKIRHLGNSVPPRELERQIPKSREFGISVIQTTYNVVNRLVEAVLPLITEQDLGLIARTPLASGFLSGAYQPGHEFPHSDVRSMRPQEGRDREIQAALAALGSKPDEMPAATWAGAWCLQEPAVSVIIPGSKSIFQLEQNVAAADVQL